MRKFAIGIILTWLCIISFMVIKNEMILTTGQEVLLKTVPVDPRDFLRGDYVVLNYEISRINLNELNKNSYASISEFNRGDDVYLTLKKDKGVASAVELTTKLPSSDKLFIKGKIKYHYGNFVSISYGIENYFVPEGKGREIERARGKDLFVKASINNAGEAKIKELIFNSKL